MEIIREKLKQITKKRVIGLVMLLTPVVWFVPFDVTIGATIGVTAIMAWVFVAVKLILSRD
jgi:hypothetical protein